MSDVTLDSLNPAQREVVEHFEGPALVLAGAGSGKTRVLTTRIVHLIRQHGVPPARILAVTFTNKAAGEMRGRIRRLLGNEPSGLWMGTFHAVGARLLRRHAQLLGWTSAFTIFDAEQSLRLIRRTQGSLGIDPKKWNPTAVRAHISAAKNQLVSPQRYIEDHSEGFDLFVRNVTRVYPVYQTALADQNAFDFDDLLVKPVELFQAHSYVLQSYRDRFSFVLVDEYQDTNHAQFRFLELLAKERGNLMVVGDDDQCVLPGTPVATPSGPVPIEQVEVGSELLAPAGWGQVAPAQIEAFMERPYLGPVIRLRTARGHELRATPNHLGYARLVIDPELWTVCLMEREGLGYRIGVARGGQSRRVGDLPNGLAIRVSQEGADRAWVLATARSESDARFLEALYAARYGIPSTGFHPRGQCIALDEAQIDRLFAELDTMARAERLLSDLLLFPEYPHHVPGAVVRGQRVRRQVYLTLFGDAPGYRGRPWHDHRIQLCSSGDESRTCVEDVIPAVCDGKLSTWRVETARREENVAWGLCRSLAAAVEGDIRVRARLVPDGPFDLMPVGHMFPGMEVPVLGSAGSLTVDRIESRQVVDYDGPVMDLSVSTLRHYVAGGLCVHNSIYRFRGADIRNILEFEQAFPGARVIRLEQNYRSTSAILDAANAVISENLRRKGKTLRTDRLGGEPLTLVETLDETDEARWIVEEVRARYQDGPALHNYRDFAILYRTNAQARALEEAFRRANIRYQVVGGMRFYERREIQDVMAYLRLISNPRDGGAFERIVNFPRRGIGDTTLERLGAFAEARGLMLLEAVACADAAGDIPSGGARGLRAFAGLIQRFSAQAATVRVGTLIEELVEELDLLQALRDDGPEGEDRAENVKELIAGALDFDAELLKQGGEDGELDGFSELDLFLQQVALVTDIDRHDPEFDAVTLMTLHNAKGLEFPVVFIAGLEDGLFPMSRAFDEPEEMEEERRIFYVGITRAQDKLYLLHARQRRRAGEIMYGRLSPFVETVPEALLERRTSPLLMREGFTTPHRRRHERMRERRESGFIPDDEFEPSFDQDAPRLVKGERVQHATFGSGRIVEVSGFGPDVRVTVEFEGVGRKKLVARFAGLKKDYF